MKTAGNFVRIAAELAARVERGQDRFERRDLRLFMDVDWNTATVVVDCHDIFWQKLDGNVMGITSHRFIDRVVNDLPHEVMEAVRARRTNVHARTLTNGFEAFENVNILRVIRGARRLLEVVFIL